MLDAQTSPFIDITGAEMLARLAVTLRRDGIELRIASDIGQFRDVMRSPSRRRSTTRCSGRSTRP